MSYNFIKDILSPVVDELNTDVSALESFIVERDNSFILKHNIYAISQILNFLNSSENIFILNGFMGSGKTYTAECMLDFVNENVLIFKNEYKNALNLDDILLSLFKDFSIYHNEGKIMLPKTESSIFSEKINTFIKYCDAPMLFLFDSFEINTKSKDSQKDILDFINYLSRFEKVKIIICSRSFKPDDLEIQDSTFSYSLTAVSKEEMYDYLEENEITGGNYETEELYKETRGHYLLLEFSVLIMHILNITLTAFSNEYKKATKNFLEFTVSKILSLSAERFIKPLILLSAIRHGITADFLIEQNFAAEDDLNFLLKKHIISEKYGKYYIKDYIKNEFIKTVNIETQIRIHKYLSDVYEAELPLKPFDRALFLSRQTMRQEIAYHTKKIAALEEELAKTGRTALLDKHELTYMTYTHSRSYKQQEKTAPRKKRYIDKIRNKSNKNKRFELSDEDSLLLNSISGTDNVSKELEVISRPQEETVQQEEYTDKIPCSMDEYIEIAQNYENAFNFSNAITYYKQALTYTNDKNYDKKQPVIYTKLAICYKKIQDTEEAIKLYEKVYSIYFDESSEKANDILLSIAEIYAESYKFDKAKETYNRILYSPIEITDDLKTRVYLDIAELEDNSLNTQDSVKYIQKALSTAEKSSDTKLLSECYFKYALILDDTNNTDLAQKYYLRCIQTSDAPEENTFLSSAYSNLAELSLESGSTAAAKMYYELSVEADKKINNYEGLYYSYTKLANIYKSEDNEQAYEYLVKALSSSKRFDDINYSLAIYIEIGSWYISKGNYKKALKSYILAKNLNPSRMNSDNLAAINSEINRIKIRVGDIEFSRLMNEIKKKI